MTAKDLDTSRKVLIVTALVWSGLFVVFMLAGFLNEELVTTGDIFDLLVQKPLWLLVLGLPIILILMRALAYVIRLWQRSQNNISARSRRIGLAQQQKCAAKYREVEQLLHKGGPSSFRSAVVIMDALLDDCLKQLGYTGSLGKKLKQAGQFFSDLDSVWHAHKYRNRLVHEVQYEPMKPEARDNVERLRRALSDLGAL